MSVAALFFASFTATAQTTTIYQHDFNGNAQDQLGGTTTDVGDGTWFNANFDDFSSFYADGSVVEGFAPSGIWLPFTVEQGNVYTLSADVDLTAGDWISLGYALFAGDKAFFGTGGAGTAIVKPESMELFAGVGTAGKSTIVADAGVQQIKIVLDATAANTASWTIEFFESGVSVAGPLTAASGDFGSIQNVGFTTANGSSTGTVDNFSFTVGTEVVGAQWGGYDIIDGRYIDTDPWLGFLEITNDPWLFSYSLEKYIYLPESQVSTSGAWMYIPNF